MGRIPPHVRGYLEDDAGNEEYHASSPRIHVRFVPSLDLFGMLSRYQSSLIVIATDDRTEVG